jgi:subtilisin family serine protease
VHTDDPRITDTPSEFSSRDVRGPALKPDVAAPGDTITSALTGSGSGVLVISGTSMAAPHVAGIGALVRQAHPDWSVAEVKAAVVNTAGADVYSRDGQQGPIVAPNRVGAGRVDAAAAVGNQVLAMVPDDPGQVSADFGVWRRPVRSPSARRSRW